ncbi:FecR protein [Planctomycetes bacterium CA13]|uniref:FecR protein n=1 Tax=Novipirellula herctigrandis TaxID=2527986 RepID=A0A5C5YW61_9BACT|nr:FecR protein [Planctomycetes bacterium CA13]
MDTERLEKLLDRYFDEGLTEATKQELEEELLSSPQARELFWQRGKLNSLLRQNGQEVWGDDQAFVQRLEDPAQQPNVARSLSPLLSQWIVSGIAVSMLIAVFGYWSIFHSTSKSDIAFDAQQIVGSPAHNVVWMAAVRRAVAVQWLDPEGAPRVGEPMGPSRFQLESGLIEIQTNRGALITVEGPADIEIISDMAMRCRSGRIRVDAPPPAFGFLVQTEHVYVVNRGTSFAMNVSADNEAEIHVIKGMVELISPSTDNPIRELRQGESVGVVTDGTYREIPSKAETFPSAAIVMSRTQRAKVLQRKAWERRRAAIVEDPSCLVYFDFEGSDSDDTVMENHALRPSGAKEHVTDGTIIGCDFTDGRWPGKHALEFKNVFDRVLFSVPGEHETLTAIASVRLDAMDTNVAALLMPDDSSEGNLQWQISRNKVDLSVGRLRLGQYVQSESTWLDCYSSKPILRPERFGTWVQLAFVWDAHRGTCSQFVNGELVGLSRLSSQASILKTGQLELGNGNAGHVLDQSIAQNFNGRMDEFAMFDRALTPQEILAHHDLENVSWTNQGGDNVWGNVENWAERITPLRADTVLIDTAGPDKAIYSEGTSEPFQSLYVGSNIGGTGELDIIGGNLNAHSNSSRHTRVGLRGGDGTINQNGGDVNLNSLQIGLDPRSIGTYHLKGGNLTISRAVNNAVGSLDIGAKSGIGTFKISGGSLLTRRGVSLGRDDGVGSFFVEGSAATSIEIGKEKDHDGFWIQHPGSTLKVLIDDQGVTPISIDEVGGDEGGDVTFAEGAWLDVGFLDAHRSGSWDIIKWDGVLTDQGLQFAHGVDPDVWHFEFVDTDGSGRSDTLRVISTQP